MADGGAEARAGLSALINCQAMPKQQQRQQQQLRDNCNGDNVAANAAIAVAIAIAAVWPLHRVAVAFAKLQPEGGRGGGGGMPPVLVPVAQLLSLHLSMPQMFYNPHKTKILLSSF